MIKDYDRKCCNRDCNSLATIRHHKDRDRENNHPSNFRYLCSSCHNKEHSQDNWETNVVFRSKDTLDDMQAQKTGYRLSVGFSLLQFG